MQSQTTRLVARCIVTIGIVLSMLLAGAAPVDFLGAQRTAQVAR